MTSIRTLRTAVLRCRARSSQAAGANGWKPARPLAGDETPQPAQAIAAQLLSEQDSESQRRLAERAYAEFSDCAELSAATAAVPGNNARERWPGVKHAFASSLPSCRCDSIDAPALRAVLSAEQRAGTATLGAVPLRCADERCHATMALRSVNTARAKREVRRRQRRQLRRRRHALRAVVTTIACANIL